MQIGDNLHDMPNPAFWGKKIRKNISNLAQRVLNVNNVCRLGSADYFWDTRVFVWPSSQIQPYTCPTTLNGVQTSYSQL